MTNRPINMRDFEVRALLAGRKTQKRVVLKSVPPMPDPNCHPNHKPRHKRPYLDSYCGVRPTPNNPRGMTDRWLWWQVDDRACLPEFKVSFVPGDRLWVRENIWQASPYPGTLPSGDVDKSAKWSSRLVHYAADGSPPNCANRHYGLDGLRSGGGFAAPDPYAVWLQRPPIHMPRWASRITLLVEAVRVERLQDISDDDARAEGIRQDRDGAGTFIGREGPGRWVTPWPTAREAYADIWNHINGPDAWATNPWVVAITFRPMLGNIDSLGDRP